MNSPIPLDGGLHGVPLGRAFMTGRGRPPIGERVDVRLPADLLGYVDAWRADLGISRAAMLRHLLEHGMDTVTDDILEEWRPEGRP